MCVQYMKIRSLEDKGLKKAFIPCGKCEECRQSLKNQWSFRLRCELEEARKKKWHIGFFTLTYNDESLPFIPSDAFIDSDPFEVACFSRKHVRTFVDSLRKEAHKTFGVSGLRYLVAGEYGDNTKRPHYHGLIVFPPSVRPEWMFNKIHSLWHYGFIFPRDIRGGVDSHGYEHKPFLVRGDIAGAARYAAKYCCKDLGWYASVKGLEFDRELIKDCKPFHIQSRSIGFSFLSGLDSATLMKYLKNGVSFLGEKKNLPLPLYLKNKVLYSPRYDYQECSSGDWWYDFELSKWCYKKGQGTHKRLVRRDPTAFFDANFKELYSLKCLHYEDLFTQMASSDFWTARQVNKKLALDVSSTFTRMMSDYGFDAVKLSRYFVAFYGVSKDRCFDVPLERQYYARIKHHCFKNTPLFDSRELYRLDGLIGLLLGALHYSVSLDVQKRARLSRLLDYYKSRS